MFEQTDPQAVLRAENEVLRRMLFGLGGKSPDVPTMATPAPAAQDAAQQTPGDDTFCMREKPLAMAYVPCQAWRELMEPAEALRAGTLFRELDKPFRGRTVTVKKQGGNV